MSPASSAAHYSSITSQLLLSRGSERDPPAVSSARLLGSARNIFTGFVHHHFGSPWWRSKKIQILFLNLQGPQGSPQGGFSFTVLTIGQAEAAELWERPVFGSFPHRGWPELLIRHLQRDRSLQEPTVGMAHQPVLSGPTEGAPHIPLGSRLPSKIWQRKKHHIFKRVFILLK